MPAGLTTPTWVSTPRHTRQGVATRPVRTARTALGTTTRSVEADSVRTSVSTRRTSSKDVAAALINATARDTCPTTTTTTLSVVIVAVAIGAARSPFSTTTDSVVTVLARERGGVGALIRTGAARFPIAAARQARPTLTGGVGGKALVAGTAGLTQVAARIAARDRSEPEQKHNCQEETFQHLQPSLRDLLASSITSRQAKSPLPG